MKEISGIEICLLIETPFNETGRLSKQVSITGQRQLPDQMSGYQYTHVSITGQSTCSIIEALL